MYSVNQTTFIRMPFQNSLILFLIKISDSENCNRSIKQNRLYIWRLMSSVSQPTKQKLKTKPWWKQNKIGGKELSVDHFDNVPNMNVRPALQSPILLPQN